MSRLVEVETDVRKDDYCYESLSSPLQLLTQDNKSLSIDSELFIRLVTVLPTSTADDIQLSIETVALSKFGNKYDAISYTWGDAKSGLHVIRIGNRRLKVRENIWRFLKHVSSNGNANGTRLWIDSICIDQKNNCEKNEQVGMMGRIFQNARRVLIWLGEASESEAIVKFAMQRLKGGLPRRHLLRDTKDAPKVVPPKLGGFIYSDEREEKCQMEIVQSGSPLLTLDNIEWQRFLLDSLSQMTEQHTIRSIHRHLRQILRNKYWQRVWIVQEIILAKHPVVMLGKQTVAMGDIHAMEQYCDRYEAEESISSDDLDASPQIDYENRVLISNLRDDWFQRSTTQGCLRLSSFVSNKYVSQKCQDPHDFVYGFLGLTNWTSKKFAVDYDEPLEVLFNKAVLYMCLENRSKEMTYKEKQTFSNRSKPNTPFHATKSLMHRLRIGYDSSVAFNQKTLSEQAFSSYAGVLEEPLHSVCVQFKGFLIPCRDHGEQSEDHRCIAIKEAGVEPVSIRDLHLEWTRDNVLSDYQPTDIVVKLQSDRHTEKSVLEVFLVARPRTRPCVQADAAPGGIFHLGQLWSDGYEEYSQPFGKARCLSAGHMPNILKYLVTKIWTNPALIFDGNGQLHEEFGRVKCSSLELIFLLEDECLRLKNSSHRSREVPMQEYRDFSLLQALTLRIPVAPLCPVPLRISEYWEDLEYFDDVFDQDISLKEKRDLQKRGFLAKVSWKELKDEVDAYLSASSGAFESLQ